jgi:hypothetical protein
MLASARAPIALPAADGGVERCDDVVECADRGLIAVSGAGFVVELIGDGGEAVDRLAVDAECFEGYAKPTLFAS